MAVLGRTAIVSLFCLSLFFRNPSLVAASCGSQFLGLGAWEISNRSHQDKVNHLEGKITFDLKLPSFVTPNSASVEVANSGENPRIALPSTTFTLKTVNPDGSKVWAVEVPQTLNNLAAFTDATSQGLWENITTKTLRLQYTNTESNVNGDCDLFVYNLDDTATIVYPLTPLTLPEIGCGLEFDPFVNSCGCKDSAGNSAPIESMNPANTAFCCGWKNGSSCSGTEPPDQDIAPDVSCGDIYSSPYACGCKNALGYVVSSPVGDGSMCCGYLDRGNATDICQQSPPPQFRCLNTPGCGFCPNAQQYCSVRGGFSECLTVPGQCGAPLPEPPAETEVSCGDVFDPDSQSCSCGGNEVQLMRGKCCGWYSPFEEDRCAEAEPPRLSCGQTSTNNKVFCPCTSIKPVPGAPNLICCGWIRDGACSASQATTVSCGEVYDPGVPGTTCNCSNKNNTCCGWPSADEADGCAATNPDPPGDGGDGDDGGGVGGGTQPPLNIFDGPSSESFKALNPLNMFDSEYKDEFTSPAGIINRALLFLFPLSGLILFVMLVWGGFEMVYSATNKKGMEAGKQRITAALIGFLLLFGSFWIVQMVEYIFNIAIL